MSVSPNFKPWKYMMTVRNVYLLTASVALMSVSHSATMHWQGEGSSDDWHDLDNWNTKYVPGNNGEEDNVIFEGVEDSCTPISSFNFIKASNFNLRDEATLTLEAGVSISNFENVRLAPNGAPKSGGHIVQTGGNLFGNHFYVASSRKAASRSSHTLSGGTVSLTGKYEVKELGDVVLTGASASLKASLINFIGASTLTFNFDTSGIGSLTSEGIFKVSEDTVLEINAGSYDRSAGGSFTLVNANRYTGFATSNIIVNGFGAEGEGYTLTQDHEGNGDLIFEVIADPEASVSSSGGSSASALIGFGSTSVVISRPH
ncbi:hypothetical protein ACFPK9_14460 [Rubritalea spongiae]|uniref:Uncharacterized protein n=1 Tax=Rubritalea spongiae TaxID=430797 RepID=A0ABW5E0F5_9BACT